MNLIKRMEAAQATVDRFKNQHMNAGKIDCVQMAVWHARRCKKKMFLPKYKSLLEGSKLLQTHGYPTLIEYLGAHLKPIDPHERLMADIIAMPGQMEDGLGFVSIAVDLGGDKALGFVEEIPFATIIEPVLIVGAWSVG